MTRQTQRPGSGINVGLLSSCPVDAGWYERYWYGDNLPSWLSVLLNIIRGVCRQLSGSAALAIGGVFSSLDHGRARLAVRQGCEAAGD
jgi:hypothetical protein